MKLAGIRNTLEEAGPAVQRTPVEIALGVLLAVTFSAALRTRGEEWIRILLAVAIAWPLVFSISVSHLSARVSRSERWSATVAVLLAAAAYAGPVADPAREVEQWRAPMLVGAAWLAPLLVPGWSRDAEGRHAWSYRLSWGLLLRAVVAVLYGAALMALLSAAVASVVSLFDLPSSERVYGDLAGFIFFAIVPWILAAGAANLAEPGEEPPPGIVGFLGRFLFFPVLLLYLGILYAYGIKVVVTGELPRNLVSPLVLLAGTVGFLGVSLAPPARSRLPEVTRFVRWLPLLILPLLPLGIWALLVRVDQYGWTEFRYLRVLALGVLVLLSIWGAVLRLRGRPSLRVAVPAVAAGALLLGAVGPWSAPSVSLRSQRERLLGGLREAGLLTAAGVARSGTVRDLDAELYERIVGAARYLESVHGFGTLGAAGVPGGGDVPLARLAVELGIAPGCGGAGGELLRVLPDDAVVSGIRGERLTRFHLWERSGLKPDSGRAVGLADDRRSLRVQVGPKIARVPLDLLLGRESTECGPRGISVDDAIDPEEALLPAVTAQGDTVGQILIERVHALDEGGELRVHQVQGMLLVR